MVYESVGGREEQHLPVPDEQLRAYHLEELAIAREVVGAQVLSYLPEDVRVVLDVGCGAGQTLVALAARPALVRVGVDSDQAALGILRESDAGMMLLAGSGEALPLASGSCDAVICRVALPYMHVATALGEMARVLRPGGRVFLTLHPYELVLRHLLEDAGALRLRGVLYRAFVLVNGLLLHATGRQTRYPLNRKRQETFQTAGGMRRLLEAAGLHVLEISHDGEFVVRASKPSVPMLPGNLQ